MCHHTSYESSGWVHSDNTVFVIAKGVFFGSNETSTHSMKTSNSNACCFLWKQFIVILLLWTKKQNLREIHETAGDQD